jgi:hypothetical protein
VGTGSRQENAIKRKREAFSGEVGTGSRQENAIRQRKKHFQAKHVPREGGDGNRFA